MMAPHTYFNWDTVQIPTSEKPYHELILENLFSHSDENLSLSSGSFENYIDPIGGSLYPSDIDPHLYDPFVSLPHPNIFPTPQEHALLQSSKRQKCCCGSEMQKLTTQTARSSSYVDEFVVPYDNFYSSHIEELQQQISGEFAQLDGTCEDLKFEKKEKERTISPQSVAARERRRKITEKTQQLGKLVPGGPKMNTAEMLHAAAKYVKYLQAQVMMLRLTKSLEEDNAETSSEILQTLVVSSFVQEKLYTEEMCFVPKETVFTLTNDEDVQSRPTILEDLKQLIGTNIANKEKQE